MPVTIEELASPRTLSEEIYSQTPIEMALDRYLATLGTVKKPSFLVDRSLGIDRILDAEGVLTSFQYKADFQAHKTGNMFIETEQRLVHIHDGSVTKEWKGWYNTMLAQILLSVVPQTMTVHVCNVGKLKALAKVFASRYPLRRCKAGSKSFSEKEILYGFGYAVPLNDLMELGAVSRIIRLNEDVFLAKPVESPSST